MKKRKWLVVLYLICFLSVNISLEYAYHKGLISYDYYYDGFAIDRNGVVYTGGEGVVQKHDKGRINYIRIPVKHGYYMDFSPDDALLVVARSGTYSLDPEVNSVSEADYVIEYDPSRAVQSGKQYVDAAGLRYDYDKKPFRRGRIVDQNGKTVYVEPLYNYLSGLAKTFQTFAGILAMIMVSSGGRPILFLKISVKEISRTGRMSLSPKRFEELLARYGTERDKVRRQPLSGSKE